MARLCRKRQVMKLQMMMMFGTGMMIFLIILLIVVVCGITILVKYPEMKKIRDKRIAAEKSGDLVKREVSFYENEEFLTCKVPADMQAFCKELTARIQKADVCQFSGDYNQQVIFVGKNIKWRARLTRLQTDDPNTMKYVFGMLDYQQTQLSGTANTMYFALDMNYVLTAIERTFLQFDPDTKVETRAIDLKTTYK